MKELYRSFENDSASKFGTILHNLFQHLEPLASITQFGASRLRLDILNVSAEIRERMERADASSIAASGCMRTTVAGTGTRRKQRRTTPRGV
jgi:hypothetical protein